jgi:hypothetical protein
MFKGDFMRSGMFGILVKVVTSSKIAMHAIQQRHHLRKLALLLAVSKP